MTHDSEKLWTRGFILAVFLNFFIVMVYYLLVIVMALYAVERFQASDAGAGLASSTFVIGALVARVFAGKFLDFVGRNRMMLLGLAAYAVAGLLYIPADNFGLLLAVRALHGMAFGVASTVIAASIIGLIPLRRRGEGIGYYSISNTLATAAGPYLAVLLVNVADYSVLFVTSSVFAAIAFVIALLLRLPERIPTPDERLHKWRMRLGDVLDPSVLGIASVMFMAGFGFSGILTFLTYYARQEHMIAGASAFFLIYAGVVFLSRFVVGRIQDAWGDNAVVYPLLVLFVVGLAMVAYAPNGVVLALAGVCIAFGYGALMPTGQTIAITVAPEARVGIATSTFFISLDAGFFIGPLVLGLLVPVAGFRGMYLTLAATMLATIVLYYFVHGRRSRGEPLAA